MPEKWVVNAFPLIVLALIFAEGPWCHKKQSIRNRKCACGSDLTAAKRAKKVRYWGSYRLPGCKQRREYVGNDPDGQPLGIEEAKAAEGKRKAQKYENGMDVHYMAPSEDDLHHAMPAIPSGWIIS